MPQLQPVARSLLPRIATSLSRQPRMSFPRPAFTTHDRAHRTPHTRNLPQGSRDERRLGIIISIDCRCPKAPVANISSRPFGPSVHSPRVVKAPPTHTLTVTASKTVMEKERSPPETERCCARSSMQTWTDPAAAATRLPGLIHAQYRLLGPVGHPQTSLHHATCGYITFDFNYSTTAGVCCDSRLSVRSATDAFLLLSLQTLTLFLRRPSIVDCCTSTRLTTADIARLCVRLLSFWKHGCWQHVIFL
jgi:hypothetical protein